MKTILKKIKNKKGESLAEVFVAILIAAAGLLLLSSMLMSSDKLTSSGQSRMKEIYDGSSAVETHQGTSETSGNIAITDSLGTVNITVPVKVYSDTESGFISYKKE